MTAQAWPVHVENLAKTYLNGVEALKGISLTVADGEIFGLVGPNGAGKTTALGILTTIVRPTAGRALVAGYDVTGDPLSVRRAIGVLIQDSVLDNEFSGIENLRLHARLWGVPRGDHSATHVPVDRVPGIRGAATKRAPHSGIVHGTQPAVGVTAERVAERALASAVQPAVLLDVDELVGPEVENQCSMRAPPSTSAPRWSRRTSPPARYLGPRRRRRYSALRRLDLALRPHAIWTLEHHSHALL